MASKSAERREPVTRGTGNVFADLGFPDAAERQARLRLAYALNQELEARKISQADAAKVLGVTQPKVSALRRYKLEGFSVERLMNLLTALDQDVEIVIRRKPRSRKAGADQRGGRLKIDRSPNEFTRRTQGATETWQSHGESAPHRADRRARISRRKSARPTCSRC